MVSSTSSIEFQKSTGFFDSSWISVVLILIVIYVALVLFKRKGARWFEKNNESQCLVKIEQQYRDVRVIKLNIDGQVSYFVDTERGICQVDTNVPKQDLLSNIAKSAES